MPGRDILVPLVISVLKIDGVARLLCPHCGPVLSAAGMLERRSVWQFTGVSFVLYDFALPYTLADCRAAARLLHALDKTERS